MYLKKKNSMLTPAILPRRLDSGKLWAGDERLERENYKPPPPGNLENIPMLAVYDYAYVPLELSLICLHPVSWIKPNLMKESHFGILPWLTS